MRWLGNLHKKDLTPSYLRLNLNKPDRGDIQQKFLQIYVPLLEPLVQRFRRRVSLNIKSVGKHANNILL